jgi:nicotinate-nucleotide pyrophosphorylase (carboxylating)
MGVNTIDDVSVLARAALAEDAPAGDLTTQLTVVPGVRCAAELVAKGSGILAGMTVGRAVFEVAADASAPVLFVARKADGDALSPGDIVAVVQGTAATLLRAERPALNLLSHLSGVATLTRAFVDAAAPATILCTRKTTPGLRRFEREAVVAGGGMLHRASLSDAVLIKDNHVRLAGGVAEAVGAARDRSDAAVEVEVEVETIEQLDEAVTAGADRVLLDNPTPRLVRAAVDRIGDASRLEVSGGVTLENVRSFVDAGARVISVGRLTHSAPALDLSMEITDVER